MITGQSKEAAGQTWGHGNPNIELMDKDNKDLEAKLEIVIDSPDKDKKVAVAGDHQSEGSKPVARIQRAPSVVSNNKNLAKHLEPKAFFFGPIHHKKQKPEDTKTKMKLAERFIRDNSSIDKQAAFNNILREMDSVRRCYENEVIKDYDDEELASMLFVDGCALLFYIVSFMRRSLYKLSIENLPVAYVENDIFLLENQLPYCVLDLIVRGTALEEKMPGLIDDFVKIQSSTQGVTIGEEQPKMGKWKPNHLLELLWMRTTRDLEWSWADEDIGPRKFWQDSVPISDHGTVLWYPSRSVSELKSVRINVKPNNSIWLRDINFQHARYSGELELRSLIVHAHTAVKLSNLMAYEMCPDFKNDLEVTSYVCFLSSLLRDVKDVAKLRSNKVLVNLLPSDDSVCQLFRELATDLVPNHTLYDHVRKKIGDYFDEENTTAIATWWVDAAEVYFKTPWSTIAVLAAAFAILVSVVQTWFTISPRKSGCD